MIFFIVTQTKLQRQFAAPCIMIFPSKFPKDTQMNLVLISQLTNKEFTFSRSASRCSRSPSSEPYLLTTGSLMILSILFVADSGGCQKTTPFIQDLQRLKIETNFQEMLHGLVMLIGPLQTWLSLIRLHTLGQKRRGLHTNVSHFGNVRIIFRNSRQTV